MSIRFHRNFFIAALFLLTVEVCIALFIKQGSIRHTFGDVLATILLYCIFRSFLDVKPLYLAISVLLFSYAIEFSQLLNLLEILGLRENKFLTIVLGSTFHTLDLIAYTLGALFIFIIDSKISMTWKP
ncbi:DUF2809 domain-containing protein [Sediminibacter sp. Hel_I_10]|uniref:ribosomal maturation YjgA family protein n=1 Tax=Sediminibacter sp. Hel_I_10 TaxID=1392490 RepID=UPI00047C684A|nr:DUF2809 domain-containing protein [Sediminibacter sp. Hel_I_10]